MEGGQKSSWGCDLVMRSLVFAFGAWDSLPLPFLPGTTFLMLLNVSWCSSDQFINGEKEGMGRK